MKLTDNEIRDINRYLEEGKPLPEKYRFLLFEDKRGVELVWNGKTSEVCNVVLPFQVIEQVDEPREEKAVKLEMELLDMQTGRQIKGWNNKLIWGDNKLILSSLKNGPLREEIEAKGADESLKKGKSRVIVDKGQVVKISKDKNGIVNREVLTQNWTDWIDYWAVDFDFESKREIVRVESEGGFEEVWTGDYVFENEWQSFRTKKDRSLELKSVFRECPPGRRKIAVKVVDIFGNDTMKIIEVSV